MPRHARVAARVRDWQVCVQVCVCEREKRPARPKSILELRFLCGCACEECARGRARIFCTAPHWRRQMGAGGAGRGK